MQVLRIVPSKVAQKGFNLHPAQPCPLLQACHFHPEPLQKIFVQIVFVEMGGGRKQIVLNLVRGCGSFNLSK